jgi:hypothetical protein
MREEEFWRGIRGPSHVLGESGSRRWTLPRPGLQAVSDGMRESCHPLPYPRSSPPKRGRPLTADTVAQRLRVHTPAAATTCPALAAKAVTPHVLRHTNSMRRIAAGIATATSCLWLVHESLESTQAHLHADLGVKQWALDRTAGHYARALLTGRHPAGMSGSL